MFIFIIVFDIYYSPNNIGINLIAYLYQIASYTHTHTQNSQEATKAKMKFFYRIRARLFTKKEEKIRKQFF